MGKKHASQYANFGSLRLIYILILPKKLCVINDFLKTEAGHRNY